MNQKGYTTLLLMGIIFVALLIFAFISEIGRILIINAQVERAAEAAANAASYTLGEVVVELTGEGTPLAVIKEEARQRALEAAQELVEQNKASFVPPLTFPEEDNDFKIEVTAKKEIEPIFGLLLGNKKIEIRKTVGSKIRIK